MFKRKYEFKPDRDRSSALSKLYLTKKQRRTLLKWLLIALVLVFISVVQDVVLSKVKIFGVHTDLVACAILLVCILQDPEIGCVFGLVSSSLYWFSGSAPGPYVIALLTVLGVVVSIFRHSYLRASFGSAMLCTAGTVMLYELLVFAVGFFLGRTTGSRLLGFCVTGGVSLAIMPFLYPVFVAISKIGGESWKE